MLPDIGASELMVIALAALIFVGPKDLPLMLKKLGQFTSKMRRLAADFRTSFDDMARQSELEDLRREVEQMRASASQAISDPAGLGATLNETMDDVEAGMNGGAPSDYDYDPGVPVVEETASAPEPPVASKPEPRKRAASPANSKLKKPLSPAKTKPSTRPAGKAAAKPRGRSPSKEAR